MLRRACSKACQMRSSYRARHTIYIQRPDLGSGKGFRLSACPTSQCIRNSTPACKLSMIACHGTSSDDMVEEMTEIRGRLASIESMQREQLSLQREMADDLEALLEGFDGMKDRLAIMSSLVTALTKLFLSAQSGSGSSESSGSSEQPFRPEGVENVSQPESPHEHSQGR